MQDIKFVSHTVEPEDRSDAAYWFIFQGNKLLTQATGDTASVPLIDSPDTIGIRIIRRQYLGHLELPSGDQIHCFSAEMDPEDEVPDGLGADGLRQLYHKLDDHMFMLAGRGVQVMDWDRTHLYCGRCATATETLSYERAKKCPECELTSYPRLSPAIIIAVVRQSPEGKQLMLARNHRFPTGFYSVIAGFVEPGETLEECAEREVGEEVGIHIKNIRYFASQSWPFPNSLMLGFTADYAGGEIVLEEAEIADANWFAADKLPHLPPKISIARRLIDWFVEESGK